ncbi:unnamed protein product, partial [Symbiodinium sp. CCMP2592]
ISLNEKVVSKDRKADRALVRTPSAPETLVLNDPKDMLEEGKFPCHVFADVLDMAQLAEEVMPDSDNEDDISSSANMERAVQSSRKLIAMEKHHVNIMMSPSPNGDKAGLGLVTTVAMKKGHEIPVRGPIFKDSALVLDFLEKHPTYVDRVLKFSLGHYDGGATPSINSVLFLVQTGLTGFINHFSGLARQSNAKLVVRLGNGLGDALFYVQATKGIPKNSEILLNYGEVCFPVPKLLPMKPKAKAKAKGQAAAPPEPAPVLEEPPEPEAVLGRENGSVLAADTAPLGSCDVHAPGDTVLADTAPVDSTLVPGTAVPE